MSALLGFALWIGQTLAIVAGHVIVIALVPVLANVVERAHTHGEKEKTIMLKLTFFQWFYNVLTAITLLWIETPSNPEPRGHFSKVCLIP